MADSDSTNPLQAVQTAAANYGTQAQAAGQQVAGLYSTSADLEKTNADAQTQIAVSDNVINNEKAAQVLATQNARNMAGAIFGTDLRLNTSAIQQLSDQADMYHAQRVAALQNIQQKEAVNWWEDPLQWVQNKITIGQDYDAHNTASSLEAAALTAIQEKTANTQAVIQNQNSLENTVTQAGIDAQSKKTLAAGLINANKAQIDGLGMNIKGIQALTTASQEQLSAARVDFDAINQQKQLAISQEHLALAKSSDARAQQVFLHQKQEWQTEQDYNDKLAGDYNRGVLARGGPDAQDLVVKPGSQESKLLAKEINAPGPRGDSIRSLILQGQSGQISTTPTGVIQQLVNPSNGMKVNVPIGEQPMVHLLDSVSRETATSPLAANHNLKDKNELTLVQMAQVEQKVDTLLKDRTPGQDPLSNPFAVPTTNEVISHSPALQELPFVKNVILPLGDKVNLTPGQMFQAGLDAVAAGKIKIDDFTHGMQTVANTAVQYNNLLRQPTKYAITPTDAAALNSYNTKLQLRPGWGGTSTVDIADYTKLAAAASKAMGNKAALENLSSGTAIGYEP